LIAAGDGRCGDYAQVQFASCASLARSPRLRNDVSGWVA
jgi:hypothetical protein